MNENNGSPISRRDFLKDTGKVTAASALTLAGAIPAVHAQGTSQIQVAFVGCGGRGTGAAAQALNTNKQGPIRLIAMADAFEDRLKSSHKFLSEQEFSKQVAVPEERQFVGWDAYKKAMDCLRPGDVVILTTPPAFRWVQFQYAIQKGLNVFMEKPVTVDGPTSKRMIELAAQASAKNLKCGVGLMSRHYKPLQQLAERVRNGEIGDIVLMRGYRMHGPGGYFQSTKKPEGISHLDYQTRRFHSFLWASGGNYSDFYIHIIDHLGWMKGAWPVKAQGLGGRHYKTAKDGQPFVDQNFDNYSVEYTFADGSKFFFDGRCMDGAHGIYSSYLHGTKGSAVASRSGDFGGPAAIYPAQDLNATPKWEATAEDTRTNPYQIEWDVLISAIRNNRPHNEVKRGVEASVATSLGRMAAHTGMEITWDQMLNCEHEMAPGLDMLTKDSPAPLQPLPDGTYPKPMPGITTKREY